MLLQHPLIQKRLGADPFDLAEIGRDVGEKRTAHEMNQLGRWTRFTSLPWTWLPTGYLGPGDTWCV